MTPVEALATATLIIQNDDPASSGFNDPTPAQPVGGNAGSTIGQQRLIAFKYAALIWGSALNSSPTVRISSKFEALICDATSGVLGSAAPAYVLAGSPQFQLNSWYPAALGNALTGTDQQAGQPAINTHFNSGVGGANCLSGANWYYGLDGNVQSTDFDLVAIVLHEFAHGLGFFTTTDGSNGTLFQSKPSVFDHYLLDLTNTTHPHWDQMTDQERVTSAINTRKLVWDGQNATAQVPLVPLQLGTATLTVNSPFSAELLIGTAAFGPAITTNTNISGVLQVPSPDNYACTAPVAGSLNGRVALVDRGPAGNPCTFVQKVKNSQNAGAIAVVVVNNVAGSPPPEMAGNDSSIVIPAVHVTQTDGTTLKNQGGPVTVTVRALNIYAGADANQHPLLYTPNPYKAGSSIPHNDTITRPHLLMEPDYSTTLGHNLDLTGYFLKDIGWNVPAPNPSTNLSADVAITVTASGFRPGGSASYTVKVTNNGPTTAIDTEVLNTPPSGSGITFAGNTVDCTSAFPCLLGDMPSGSSKTFTTKYNVPATYTGNSIAGTFSAAAAVPDPNTSNNSATANSTLGGGSAGGGGCDSSGSLGMSAWAAVFAGVALALGRRRVRARR